ncbi:Imm50 family immunity protein [Streptomyces sp. NPDC086787]|uniref:Imm50 family immunity protein n=1 Tax=Streptomyces sp. NPDC086787 TaxID=3365759 RepID=UPI0037F43C63
MTVEGFLVNPEVLRSLYGHVPDLTGARIRSVNLNWRGPTVTLRVDLHSYPGTAPREWIDAGLDTVQCQFQFLAVEGISLTDWTPPVVGDVVFVPQGSERRMRVTVQGRGLSLGFTCSESVRVGHVSAFRIEENGTDEGVHLFMSRIDARRHSSLPGTQESTFYER